MNKKPVLLFAYGNISRGDDALAPLLIEQLVEKGINQACGHPLKFLTDFQMNIEHVMDMQDCERVILLDASEIIQQPLQFSLVKSNEEYAYTTHGMSPSTLLFTYHQVFKHSAPPTSLMAMQGKQFELNSGLSQTAVKSLKVAEKFLINIFRHRDFTCWDQTLHEAA